MRMDVELERSGGDKPGMTMQRRFLLTVCLVVGCGVSSQAAWAQTTSHLPEPSDSGYAPMQAGHQRIIGAHRYASMHYFQVLPDGGRILLQGDSTDSIGTARIRTHMRQVAKAFAAGDFSVPGFVHNGEAPGAAVMAAKRQVITYDVRKLPGGAEVMIFSCDTAAVHAIHTFLLFEQGVQHASGPRGSGSNVTATSAILPSAVAGGGAQRNSPGRRSGFAAALIPTSCP